MYNNQLWLKTTCIQVVSSYQCHLSTARWASDLPASERSQETCRREEPGLEGAFEFILRGKSGEKSADSPE